jgi:hypothetical protein
MLKHMPYIQALSILLFVGSQCLGSDLELIKNLGEKVQVPVPKSVVWNDSVVCCVYSTGLLYPDNALKQSQTAVQYVEFGLDGKELRRIDLSYHPVVMGLALQVNQKGYRFIGVGNYHSANLDVTLFDSQCNEKAHNITEGLQWSYLGPMLTPEGSFAICNWPGRGGFLHIIDIAGQYTRETVGDGVRTAYYHEFLKGGLQTPSLAHLITSTELLLCGYPVLPPSEPQTDLFLCVLDLKEERFSKTTQIQLKENPAVLLTDVPFRAWRAFTELSGEVTIYGSYGPKENKNLLILKVDKNLNPVEFGHKEVVSFHDKVSVDRSMVEHELYEFWPLGNREFQMEHIIVTRDTLYHAEYRLPLW